MVGPSQRQPQNLERNQPGPQTLPVLQRSEESRLHLT